MATGRAHVRDLSAILRALPPPLGLGPSDHAFGKIRDVNIKRYIYQLDLEWHIDAEGKPCVYFHELLATLVRDAYKSADEYSPFHVSDVEKLVRQQTLSKTTTSWEAVLPAEDSKIGQQLRSLLEKQNVVFQRAHAKEHEHSVGEVSAFTLMLDRWREKSSRAAAERRARAEPEALC